MSSEFISAAHGALGTIHINLANVVYVYEFGPNNFVWVLTTGEKIHTLTGGLPLTEVLSATNQE